jgi:hypothetical protein
VTIATSSTSSSVPGTPSGPSRKVLASAATHAALPGSGAASFGLTGAWFGHGVCALSGQPMTT